jgi:hypothetical protein
MQKKLLAGSINDVTESLKAREEGSRDVPCLIRKSPDMVESKNQLALLQGWMANTSERSTAYLNYNKALSGRVFRSGNYPIPCDSDREKEASALATFNTKAFNVQSAYNLPPDPGEAGKATLEGIDSNGNGVRDDVEIAIYNYAPRPDQERYRAALMQLAKYLENRVKNASLAAGINNKDKFAKIAEQWHIALACMKKESYNANASDELVFLQKLVDNTPQRYQAAMEFVTKRELSGIKAFNYTKYPVPCDYDKR